MATSSPNRTPSSMVRLNGRNQAQFMKGVMSGNPHDLVRCVLAAKSPDMSISTGLAHLLHVDIPRPSLELIGSEWYKNCLAAKGTILVIIAQCTSIVCKDLSTKDMSKFLKAEYLPLLGWFAFFLDNWTKDFAPSPPSGLSVAVAHLLRIMFDSDMDDQLASAVLSTPLAIELVFKLWTKRFDGNIYTAGSGKGCVVAELLKAVIRHDVGRDSLLVHLHAFPGRANEIVNAFRGRLRELANRRYSKSSASYSISRIRDLIHLANHLFEPSNGIPHHFLRPLRSPKLLSDICRITNTIIHRSANCYPVQGALDIISFVYDMALGERSVSSDPVKKVKVALDGGLYPLLTNVLCQLPSVEDDYSMNLGFLVEVGSYAVYPEIFPSLAKAIPCVYSGPCPFYDAHSRAYWTLIVKWTKEREDMIGAVPGCNTILCHYIQHQDDPGAEVIEARRCSRCRAVAYCSRFCQKLDWAASHRYECARILRNRSSTNPTVSLRLQVSLATFVRDLLCYDDRFSKMEGRCSLVDPTCPRVSVVDARQLPTKVKFVRLEDFARRNFGVGNIIHDYAAQLANDVGVELVDSWFPWGQYTINLWVRLRRLGATDFRTLSATVGGIWPTKTVVDPFKGDRIILAEL